MASNAADDVAGSSLVVEDHATPIKKKPKLDDADGSEGVEKFEEESVEEVAKHKTCELCLQTPCYLDQGLYTTYFYTIMSPSLKRTMSRTR